MPAEFKIKNCKKLTFRKDLCSATPIKYFTDKDRFFVDTSKVYYDFQNTPMYKAKLSYGKAGFVAKEGVEQIVRNRKHTSTRVVNPANNPKTQSR